MAFSGQTGAHIPQPVQTDSLTNATDFPSISICFIASYSQTEAHLPHHTQASLLTLAITGSSRIVPEPSKAFIFADAVV